MSRRCEITGKSVLSGNNVSHANNKLRRRFLPNLQNVSFMSETLNRQIRFRVTPSTIRTVEANGGLDAFLISSKADKLAPKAASLRNTIIEAKAKKQ